MDMLSVLMLQLECNAGGVASKCMPVLICLLQF